MTQSGASAGSAPAVLDVESAEWLRVLRCGGAAEQTALSELHQRLLRIARGELRRRSPIAGIAGPELDDLASQAADDALVAILRKLDSFRGESRFTTWAFKFVILEVSAKVGRHFWRHPAAPTGSDDWERWPDRWGFDPVEQAEGRELIGVLRVAVEEQLTERQRSIFVALVLRQVPLDALVHQLGTNRNAIYKTMFDARRKLRSALVANGYLTDETARRQ